MDRTLVVKLRFLNSILIIYSLIFIIRALYWFHNPTAAMLWFVDTPFDLFVLGIAFIIRTNLLKSNRLHQHEANPNIIGMSKAYEKIASAASKGIGIALLLYILIGIVAMIMFAVFTSIH